MKNKKGFTLVEVIVSITIIGISITTLIIILANNSKITENMNKRYNIAKDINELMDIFSSYPTNFYDILKETNKYQNIQSDVNFSYLYYDNEYETISYEQTAYYLQLEYQNIETNQYRLTISLYYEGVPLIFYMGNSSTTRTIYV